MRIVLDTNILVRAAALNTSPAAALLQLIRGSPEHELVVSRHLLGEVRDVLSRPYFRDERRVSPREVEDFCEFLQEFSQVTEPALGPAIIRKDPDDDVVLYLAVAGQVDVICTLDHDFLEPDVLQYCGRRGIRILGDRELLAELRRAEEAP